MRIITSVILCVSGLLWYVLSLCILSFGLVMVAATSPSSIGIVTVLACIALVITLSVPFGAGLLIKRMWRKDNLQRQFVGLNRAGRAIAFGIVVLSVISYAVDLLRSGRVPVAGMGVLYLPGAVVMAIFNISPAIEVGWRLIINALSWFGVGCCLDGLMIFSDKKCGTNLDTLIHDK